jgi:hypothetical protein
VYNVTEVAAFFRVKPPTIHNLDQKRQAGARQSWENYPRNLKVPIMIASKLLVIS